MHYYTSVALSIAGAGDVFYHEVLGLANETKGPGVALVPSGSDVLVLYKEGAGMSDFHFGFRLDSRSQVD